MTDKVTYSSNPPHCSKRQLLRKGVLNSLLVSAMGLYVATTPPTFGMVGGSSEESSSAVTPAPSPAIKISDEEKAKWKTWLESQGKSIEDVRESTLDLDSFRDDSLEGWNDFLQQHGSALLAREPYYQAGGAPAPLLKALQDMEKIVVLIKRGKTRYSYTEATKYTESWKIDKGLWIPTKKNYQIRFIL